MLRLLIPEGTGTKRNVALRTQLLQIENFVDTTGVPTGLGKQLHKAQALMDGAKENYLLQQTLARHVHTMVLEGSTADVRDPTVAAEREETVRLLTSGYEAATATAFLSMDPQGALGSSSVLGVGVDELCDGALAAMQNQETLARVEDHVRAKLRALVEQEHERIQRFFEATAVDASVAPGEQHGEELHRWKQKAHDSRRNLMRKHLEHYTVLLETLSVAVKVMHEHKLRSQLQYDNVKGKWLNAKCDAMCAKLRLSRSQIVNDTYTRTTVPALDVIRDELEQMKIGLSSDLARSQSALRSYNSVDPIFEQIAKEYATIMRKLEDKRWAIQQLRDGHDMQ